jgi:hypothetical protein
LSQAAPDIFRAAPATADTAGLTVGCGSAYKKQRSIFTEGACYSDHDCPAGDIEDDAGKAAPVKCLHL